MSKPYDIAILGATPAGYAAAYHLAKHRYRTIVIAAPHSVDESPLCDWVPREFFELKALPKSLKNKSKAISFKRVCYHSANLEKQVQYVSRGAVGMFLQHGALCNALRTAAEHAGVDTRSTKTPPTIQLQEEKVTLVGTIQVTAKLLLIAHNCPHDVLADLAMPVRTVPQSQLLVAGLDIPAERQRLEKFDGSMHVIELPDHNELGLFFACGEVIHLRVISNSPASGTRAAELSDMLANLQKGELLPGSLQLARARGALWRPPAGVALELETHVAKRCILIGTAGGFADSITGQTIRPSVESALLAADAAMAALKSPHVQETLMKFKTTWRKHLAEYLRPPNTSLRLLLPLLFVNKNIVTKFTQSLLQGKNI